MGDILIPALWLVAVLILAAFAFAILKRLRRVEEPGAEDQAHEQLAMFRALRDQGEMSEEEYRKVLHKLQPRIKGTGDKPESESGPGARPRT